MKNKKFTIGLAVLIAGALVFAGCTKNKTNPAPDPDKDTSAASDVALAQLTVSDLGEITVQGCDGIAYLSPMFSATPMPTSTAWGGTMSVTGSQPVITAYTVAPSAYTVVLNNTLGRDGKRRTGTLHFDCSMTVPTTNAIYARQPGLQIMVSAVNNTIVIDHDTVTINSMKVMNTTPIGFPNTGTNIPSKVNMTWSQSADISIKRADGKTVTWVGNLNKTLLNTNNTAVPTSSGSVTYTVYPSTPAYGATLYWDRAYLSFTGDSHGTINGTAYTASITKPLIRNLNTSPEAYITVGSVLMTPAEHPFLAGTMAVTPGTKSTRTIDFGSDSSIDYDANVTVDGITYPVDVKQ